MGHEFEGPRMLAPCLGLQNYVNSQNAHLWTAVWVEFEVCALVCCVVYSVTPLRPRTKNNSSSLWIHFKTIKKNS